MGKKVYIFLADGFEDIEGLTVVDLMRRAGIDIETVSIKESNEITTSHGIMMKTDRGRHAGPSGRNAGNEVSGRVSAAL